MSSFEPLPGWGRRGGFASGAHPSATFRSAPEADAPAPQPACDPAVDDAALEARVRRAYEEGLAAGRQETLEREQERAFAALEDASRAILEMRDGYLAANRRLVVDLALEAARVLSGRAAGDETDTLTQRLDAALAKVPSGGALRLHLAAPDHARLVGEGGSALATRLEGRGVTIAPDAGLAAGEFRIDAGAAELDARRATLLADLGDRLLAAAGGETR